MYFQIKIILKSKYYHTSKTITLFIIIEENLSRVHLFIININKKI